MKRSTGQLLLATSAALALSCVSQAAFAQSKIFEISSTTFKDGAMMPAKVANKNGGNAPNCVGENVSPQFSWVNPPAGTKSFAFLMTDPEGRGGQGVNHMVTYGISVDVTNFAEGELSKESPKYVGGKSTQGVGYYSGPCTPPGVQPHHYTFVLVATDLDPKDLPPGLQKEEVTAKIQNAGGPSHQKGAAGIVGLFVKPN